MPDFGIVEVLNDCILRFRFFRDNPVGMSQIPDPFLEARKKQSVLKCTFQGETLPMLLRHKDVREAASEHIERESNYQRTNGFDSLTVQLTPC